MSTKVTCNEKTIEVNGTVYVRKDTVKHKQPDGNLKIVILQRGWIMVGYFTRKGSECKLTEASVIRAWGTTKGLGELASQGPIQGKTVLDKCHGVIEFDYLTVVATVSCEEDKWVSAL